MSASVLLLQQAGQQVKWPETHVAPPATDVPDVPLSRMVLAVDWMNVNMEDLLRCGPGGVIRCNGNPHEVILPLAPFAGRPAVDGDI